MDGYSKVKKIMHSFREVNRGFYHLLNEPDQLGITIMQLLVLRSLMEEPNICLGELAERLQVGKSTMSGIVERLVKAGFLIRERSENDRTTLTLRLTEEGKEKQKETHNIFMEQMSKIVDIPDKDIKQLLQLHQLILEKLQPKGEEL
jgi:MarR family transcriptional regulator, organic hydroperoxide resistance regulator